MQTERVTRSRARTLAAAGGETPALALPDKTPATRAGARRRAAAAATAPPAAALAACAPAADNVAPVVLFDVTNDQDGAEPSAPPAEADIAPAPAAAAEPQAAAQEPAPAEEAPAAAAAEQSAGDVQGEHSLAETAETQGSSRPDSPAPPAADEPPATPAGGAPASPAPPCPGATPTGLGLSTLLPLSPGLAAVLPAATPAATPLSGVVADAGRVCNALEAAVQALGGVARSPLASSPAAAGAASPAGEASRGSPMFLGFGSPLKQEEEAGSPDGMPVSIGAAICPTSGLRSPGAAEEMEEGEEEQADATSGAALDFERAGQQALGSPVLLGKEGTPQANPTPTLPSAAATPAAAPASAVAVRTVPRAHPLTPSRQVVLEAEEEDFIMQVVSPATEPLASPAAAAAAQEAVAEAFADEEMAPSPAPEQAAVPAKPRLQSKVVVPSPNNFDPRSLRQLRREVSDRLAAKQAAAPAGLEEDGSEAGDGEEYIAAGPCGEDLSDAMGALSLEAGVHHGLRGLPTPAGKHIRFDEEGEVAAVSPRQRVFLRGMPAPQGSHMRFDD